VNEAWGGPTTKFKMQATLSVPQPQKKGYLGIVVRAARASTVFYIDPKPELN
jgi:hypothetical protein